MLALAEKTKTVPIAIKRTTTIAMLSASWLFLIGVIIHNYKNILDIGRLLYSPRRTTLSAMAVEKTPETAIRH
jgi:hypothetical protein